MSGEITISFGTNELNNNNDKNENIQSSVDYLKSTDQFIKLDSSTQEKIIKLWEEEEKLTIEERRARYKSKKYEVSEKIQSFLAYSRFRMQKAPVHCKTTFASKVAIWQGNITTLEVDAVQNAANSGLRGGGGIDGAIHSAAGKNLLLKETSLLSGCPTGFSKITRGYKLPAKYIIHTVGPMGENAEKLSSCYNTTLDLADHFHLQSIALCGVSTGIYGYPVREACEVATKTVRDWIKNHKETSLKKIIFVVFLEEEFPIYARAMSKYFPIVVKEGCESPFIDDNQPILLFSSPSNNSNKNINNNNNNNDNKNNEINNNEPDNAPSPLPPPPPPPPNNNQQADGKKKKCSEKDTILPSLQNHNNDNVNVNVNADPSVEDIQSHLQNLSINPPDDSSSQ